jgi:hypothetical protein
LLILSFPIGSDRTRFVTIFFYLPASFSSFSKESFTSRFQANTSHAFDIDAEPDPIPTGPLHEKEMFDAGECEDEDDEDDAGQICI